MLSLKHDRNSLGSARAGDCVDAFKTEQPELNNPTNNGETENGIFVSDNSVCKVNVKWACGFVVTVFSGMRPKGGVVAASATNIRENGRFICQLSNRQRNG